MNQGYTRQEYIPPLSNHDNNIKEEDENNNDNSRYTTYSLSSVAAYPGLTTKIPPIPQLPPQQSNRIISTTTTRTPLGPPPSSRRGPPSYYPQEQYVNIIEEETESLRSKKNYDRLSFSSSSIKSRQPFQTISSSPLLKYDDEETIITTLPQSMNDNNNNERVESIINRLEKGGAIVNNNNHQRTLSERVGINKIPPPIFIQQNNNNKEEKRSSFIYSTLPEMIKRATRLAVNNDNDNKTSSKILYSENDDNKNTTINDIIESFPPPMRIINNNELKTPISSTTTITIKEDYNKYDDNDNGNKKIFNIIPIWAFWTFLSIIILIISATIVIPIFLIIIPKSRSKNIMTLTKCESLEKCYNGGINILGNDKTCRCLCLNNFIGDNCNQTSTSCSLINFNDINNATIGNNIGNIIQNSLSNYSIPLDFKEILSLFSKNNLTCSLQESLILFNNKSKRDDDESTQSIIYAATPTNNIINNNNIISSTRLNDKSLNFARTIILYILQDSNNLQYSTISHINLLQYFSGSNNLGNIDNINLSNGYFGNFKDFNLILSNGKRIGLNL